MNRELLCSDLRRAINGAFSSIVSCIISRLSARLELNKILYRHADGEHETYQVGNC